MLIRIDQASKATLATQIADQIRAGISNGSVKIGDRLPPARDLALALDVNMHTVLRAFSRLRDEGLVEMRQGRGAWIRREASSVTPHLAALAQQLMTESRRLGLTRSDVIQLLERI
ncbi:GntR family transcriptional regulator [Cryobacterium lactosi]|uniref:GntR family transcriptional regulator n=1 Tax=Cryobacterium lactosi TaxID=1259202 RepID=A0A4R9BHY0_9MICO|nr:GntR family transcriptional regulator [Cryobacterium lactosi]TFD85083.1 GntR family transcriptional regulator [Cryobacterium lactosi]